MKTLWGGLLVLSLAVGAMSSFGQVLPLDVSIPGYSLGRETNAVSAVDEIDAWSFDALAGDLITIAVDTPGGILNPYVELRNSANGLLASDEDSGPAGDALISAFAIISSGTYTARVTGRSSTTGPYVIHVAIARTVQMENDGNYGNDSASSANLLGKTADGVQAKAHVAGTIMETGPAGSSDAGNTDEDVFNLGTLNAGNVVTLTFRLPPGSTLDPRVSLRASDGSVVPDADGIPTNASATVTVPIGGVYYAWVEANAGSGSTGQYLLDVAIEDSAAPKVTAVSRLPAPNANTDRVLSTFTVSFD
jgi:Bacterial pre-peptidase C-terminal domain